MNKVYQNKIVMITGVTSGIGLYLLKRFLIASVFLSKLSSKILIFLFTLKFLTDINFVHYYIS